MKAVKIILGIAAGIIFITINVIELVKINDINKKTKELQEFKEKQDNLNKSYLEMFGSIIEFQEAQIKINDYLIGNNFNINYN